jgi:TetR/AcrR family transcriptional repressor of nem operon
MLFLTDLLEPKAFDPAAKLDDAMRLFWNQGFEATSIPQLEKHLKINRFSIYDTFGNKRSLFLRVLRRYTELLVEGLVEPLESGSGGLTDLDEFLKRFWTRFGAKGAIPGCLLCNTATELGGADPEIAKQVNSYFERVELAVVRCLQRAKELGELQGTTEELRCRARLARASLQGLLVELRLSESGRRSRKTFDALRRSLGLD